MATPLGESDANDAQRLDSSTPRTNDEVQLDARTVLVDARSEWPDATTGAADAHADDGGAVANSELIVATRVGLVQGSAGGSFREHEFTARRFLGIPFGAPPTGEYRFAAPRPAPAWEGIKPALAYGPRCVGVAAATPPEGMSEDCLSLNVFTPPTASPSARPVLVYLFGGGFQTGSSAVEAQWLTQQDVVVVTLNYRVGALGFMAHPAIEAALETTSGNMGLRDQQLGLRWVRDNIAAFGGDPTRVTLFGESAGALSTCVHMLATGSEGLADAFIMESGACLAGTGRVRSREEVMAASSQLASSLCPLAAAADLLACLRAQPAEAFASVLAPGVLEASYWPHVDGKLIEAAPRTLIEQGRLIDAPFIVGSNLNERRLFDDLLGSPSFDATSFALAVQLNYPSAAGAIVDHYAPLAALDARAAWVRVWTDEYFRCPARLLVRMAADQGRRGYLYSFDVPPAVHSQDLDYVFGWPCCGTSSSYPSEAPSPILAGVSATMQGYWVNLARRGDPNGAGLPRWPVYTRVDDPHVTFATPVSAGSALSRSDCDLWDEIYATQD